MIISDKNLIDLPVYTKSGNRLGKVDGFEFDTDSQSIIRYYVRSGDILEIIRHQKELIVHRDQVAEITKERMVVDDLLGAEAVKAKQQKIPQREPVGVMGSEG